MFLHDLSKFISHKKTKKTNGTILSLPQISYIRKYNEGNVYDEYMFEVLFQLGVQKKYLKYCLPRYADFASKLFVFGEGKEPIKYNNLVEELLPKVLDEKILEDKIKKINHQYFSRLPDYLLDKKIIPENRKLNSSDILVSHQAYCFTCPGCGYEFENVAQNWVLAKMKFDDQPRLFCAQCKGVPSGN